MKPAHMCMYYTCVLFIATEPQTRYIAWILSAQQQLFSAHRKRQTQLYIFRSFIAHSWNRQIADSRPRPATNIFPCWVTLLSNKKYPHESGSFVSEPTALQNTGRFLQVYHKQNFQMPLRHETTSPFVACYERRATPHSSPLCVFRFESWKAYLIEGVMLPHVQVLGALSHSKLWEH